MINREDINHIPTMEELSEYIRNPVWNEFCAQLEEKYKISPKIEFSKCSWEYGWNIKYKKSGKSLCTIYPREGFFTVLVVVDKEWIMIDLEDKNSKYEETLKLIETR